MVDLAVVGAGITGLAAAWEAHRQGRDVVVLDAADRPGGKLGTSPVGGVPVDETADAFLVRVPEARDLCVELGIEGELVSPRPGGAHIWAHGRLRRLPGEQVLGIPTDLDALAATGVVSAPGLTRAAEDLTRPARDGRAPRGATGDTDRPDRVDGDGERALYEQDRTVGELVRPRLGDEVHDMLVAPLVGGIWAGDCDRLSIDVAAAGIAEASRRDASLIRGARAVRAEGAARAEQPVFLAPRGGMARLVDSLTEQLGDRVRPGRRVDAVVPGGTAGRRWRVEPEGLDADAVVIATPAPVTARLVAPLSPPASTALSAVEHASVALVTMAVPRDGIDHPLDGTGFLVPPSAGMLLTACSWASSKWEHLAGDGSTAILRASAGRDGRPRALELDDADLVTALRDDLHTTMGLRADPLDVRIGRWHDAFPQPRPGHLDRVGSLEDHLRRDAPHLVVAGSWARGVGIPACIREGRRAATAALDARSSQSV